MNVGLLIRKPALVFQRWAVGLQTQLTRRGHEWENLPLHQNRKMSQNPTCALQILDSIQPQETQKEIYRNFIEFEANYTSNGTYSPERIPCEAQKVWKLESNIGYSSSRAFNGAISFFFLLSATQSFQVAIQFERAFWLLIDKESVLGYLLTRRAFCFWSLSAFGFHFSRKKSLGCLC